jgi:hypothetical protein
MWGWAQELQPISWPGMPFWPSGLVSALTGYGSRNRLSEADGGPKLNPGFLGP